MKKFLLASLLVAGAVLFVPEAQAGCYQRVFVGYDRCGHPVYQTVYVPSSYESRPVYSYRAPVYSRPSYDSRRYDYGQSYSRSGCSDSRSRSGFSLRFGF